MDTISESQADDKTRDYYEDIKLTMGVAQVNLIWRHLAVTPAVLEFAWRTLKPHYLNKLIPNAAWLLRERLICPELSALSKADLKFLGNEAEDTWLVDDVLRTYERGNAQNLIALCHLQLLLNDSTNLSSAAEMPALNQKQEEREKADKVFGEIPPLPDTTDLTPEIQSLNESLANVWVPERYRGLTPSVFRHLSYWPKHLSIIAERFKLLETPAINALSTAATDTLRKAEEHASSMGESSTALLLTEDERKWLETALDRFIHGMLARGVVIVPMVRVLISNR